MKDFGDLKKRDDSFLIDAYCKSDDNSYAGILFERYMHLVFGVCMKYLKDEDEAKDAVMVIFEKLLTDLKKHKIDYFKAWLHTVAKNHCLMLLRRKKYTVPFIDDRTVETPAGMHRDEKLELEGRLDLLELALEHLDDQQKTCIRMFYLEEKSYSQITEETGFDFNQVKSYIQNGKRNLKIYMQKNEK